MTARQAHLRILCLDRCRLGGSAGPALDGEGLRVDGQLTLDRSVISAAAKGGAIRLLGARIGGDLTLRGATLRNPTGPALHADRLRADSAVFLDDGLTAEGSGGRGAVRLVGARVGRLVRLRGATVRNPSGPALLADRLHADGAVFLDDGFTAEGCGGDGVVRLLGARVGGLLRLRGATVRNPSGPALLADRLHADSDVIFDAGFTAEGSGGDGVVRLLGARVGGQLTLRGATICSRSHPGCRWAIDGLTYAGVPRLTGDGNREAWLKLLRTDTPEYVAQPYQQLAAAYRAEGHDGDVRAVLIAQRRDQIARGGLSGVERWWARMTGVLLGYGYQPWRALLYLAGIVALSVTLSLGLGGLGALARTTSPPTAPSAAPSCSLVQTIGRGLDLGAPFLPSVPAVVGSCQPTSSPAGDALTVTRWVLQLAAWALAALFIAGFTGVVRKT